MYLELRLGETDGRGLPGWKWVGRDIRKPFPADTQNIWVGERWQVIWNKEEGCRPQGRRAFCPPPLRWICCKREGSHQHKVVNHGKRGLYQNHFVLFSWAYSWNWYSQTSTHRCNCSESPPGTDSAYSTLQSTQPRHEVPDQDSLLLPGGSIHTFEKRSTNTWGALTQNTVTQ